MTTPEPVRLATWTWKHGNFTDVDLYVSEGVTTRVPSLAWIVGPVVESSSDTDAITGGLEPISAQYDLRFRVYAEADHTTEQWGRVSVVAFLRGTKPPTRPV